MRHQRLLFLALSLLVFHTLAAQPLTERQGCHFMKNQLPLKKLTLEETQALVKSQERSDSINILDYAISLDITDFNGRRIAGSTQLEFVLLEVATRELVLDLLQLTVDSVYLNGNPLAFSYDGNQITILLPENLDGEALHTAVVYYRGTPTVAASGFGGLAFQNDIAYNLGIGLGENPYNFGRSWFPCFDNFVERSTYSIQIISANGRKAYCSGDLVAEVALPDGKISRSFRIAQPLTTYLVGVAVANFLTVDATHQGAYGTHTYYKGAAMIHNLRTYLGDSLFARAQTAVLQDFAFTAVDAAQYRDHLTQVSGVDMGPFFEDWIFSPGFSNFEIEAMQVNPVGAAFEVALTIQQKLRGTDRLHTQEPLSVTFFRADWTEQTEYLMASGEFSTATFTLPFEPAMVILNHDQELNLARVNEQLKVTAAGNLNAADVDFFTLTAQTVPDSALLHIVHHWTAPDPAADPLNVQMSDTHYWSVRGILPDGFSMRSIIRYYGGVDNLDYELAQAGIETVRMMYRPTVDTEWEEYPYSVINSFGNGGLVRLDPLLPGDYALANVFLNVATHNPLEDASVVLSPNPAQDVVRLQLNFPAVTADYQVQLYDLQGQLLRQQTYPKTAELNVEWSTADLPNGLYIVEITSGTGHRAIELVVQR